jgi:hypothetical protein
VWEPGGVTPPEPGILPGTTIFNIRYYDGSVYVDDTINSSFGGNVTFPFNGQDIVTSPDVVFVDEVTTTANVVGTTFPWEDVDWNKRHYYNAKMYIGNVEVFSGSVVERDAVSSVNASITITSTVSTYDPDSDPYTITGADIFSHSGNGTKDIKLVIEAEYIINSAPWTWETTISSGNVYINLP